MKYVLYYTVYLNVLDRVGPVTVKDATKDGSIGSSLM